MNHLKSNKISPPLFNTNPNNITMQTSSLDIVCAAEEEEFFFTDTNSAVPCGEPVGLDVDQGDSIALVLFSNIYWNPNY